MARVVRVVVDIKDQFLVSDELLRQCVRESVFRLMQGINQNDAMQPDEFIITDVSIIEAEQ